VSAAIREASFADREQVFVVERDAFGEPEEAEIVRAVQDLEDPSVWWLRRTERRWATCSSAASGWDRTPSSR
jgi:hypothetical protein